MGLEGFCKAGFVGNEPFDRGTYKLATAIDDKGANYG